MLDSFARGILACCLLTTLPSIVLAQLDQTTGSTIELSEALARTLGRNPGLRAAGFAIASAEGRMLQSTFGPSPELRVFVEDVLGTDTYRGASSAETTISLGWVLERGVREQIVNAARARVDVSAVEIEIAQLDAAAETARLFVACLTYQERYSNAEEGVELARATVEAVRRRVEASRALEAELARAEAEVARAELRLDDYQHERLSAYHRLSAQWGETHPDFESVRGTLALPDIEPFEVLLARVERNPDLALFVSEARLAEAELSLATSRSRPSWELSGGLRRVEQTDDWALVGGVTVPLRMGNRNQGRIAETRASRDRIEAAAEAERVRIETELFVLYQELVHYIELTEGLETEVAPRLESALADTRRAFELGRSSYLELRAVQADLLDVAYEILDARTDAHRVAIEIERLTGEPISVSPESE